MAINVLNEEVLQVEITKSHLSALNKVIEVWNLKDHTSALSFALAVLTISKPGALFNDYSVILPTDEACKEKSK